MHPSEAEFANEAFYMAFNRLDVAAMEALWSARHEAVCLHPGWPALIGREAIIDSWRSIFANPDQPPVTFHSASSRSMGPGIVAVVCYEVVAGSTMVATNLFVEEDGQPRLVLHQSGICARPPLASVEDSLDIN
ncbi:MAG: nuclear transport factor 2 family protein [Gammaproteobacteria bacterium]|nr:nuclear transport factor 2 family protein [Gammaproteobacteria bacterium]